MTVQLDPEPGTLPGRPVELQQRPGAGTYGRRTRRPG